MTQKTFERLVLKLSQIETDSKQVGKAMGEAGGTSDHHDNFAYEQYARDYGAIMSQLGILQDKIKNAQIIVPNTNNEIIGIGHEVKLKFLLDIEICSYTILGPSDNDPTNGWISCLTPLATAILGKHTRDTIVYKTPGGTEKILILDFKPGNF